MLPAPVADKEWMDEFAPVADDTVGRRYEYLDRCRRVHVGTCVTVVFEDRQTLWFRMQELARLARVTTVPEPILRKLDWYSSLLPATGRLTAAVSVGEFGRRPGNRLYALRAAISKGLVGLCADDGRQITAIARPGQVTERLIGLARWVEFPFTFGDRAALADPQRSWRVIVDANGYNCESDPISLEMRHSLLADLG